MKNKNIKNLIIYAAAIAICSQLFSCANQSKNSKFSFDVPKVEINTDNIETNYDVKTK